MSTFCAVDDATLITQIQCARKRIVFIAPGVHEPVAKALGKRFSEIDGLDVTVVLDPDEEVCRIGFGDIKGLELVHEYAKRNHFAVKSQSGLRVGVLLADDITLIWSPTPRSVEAPPVSKETEILAAAFSKQSAPSAVTKEQLLSAASAAPIAPNGLLLGMNPGKQLAEAVAAEGTNADPKKAEIGKSAITPDQVKTTVEAIKKNPPIPVDLAQVTRVFSSKLQFVELEINNAKISSTQLTVPSELLNADAKGELKELIRSRLRAFSQFKNVEVSVPAYLNGKPLFGKDGNALMDSVSEASLQRSRTTLERKFIYGITGYGRLSARDDKGDLETQVAALKVQLLAHSKELKKLIESQSSEIIDEAIDLIMDRARRSGASDLPEPGTLREVLQKGLKRRKEEEPKVSLIFKDVTYEQTKSEDFRNRVAKALPAHKRKQLGKWSEHFNAAHEATSSKP